MFQLSKTILPLGLVCCIATFASVAHAEPQCGDAVMRKALVRNVAKQLNMMDPIPTDLDTHWYAINGGLDDSKKSLVSSHKTVSRVSYGAHTWMGKTMPKNELAVTLKRVGGSEALVKLCAYKVPGKWDYRNPDLMDYKKYDPQISTVRTAKGSAAVNLSVDTPPTDRYVYLVYIEPQGATWTSFAYNLWIAAKARL